MSKKSIYQTLDDYNNSICKITYVSEIRIFFSQSPVFEDKNQNFLGYFDTNVLK